MRVSIKTDSMEAFTHSSQDLTLTFLPANSNPSSCMRLLAYPEVLGADVEPGAHVQEVRHALFFQQNVNGHRAAGSRIQ